MRFFVKMGEYQPLPVNIEIVLADAAHKYESASDREWFHQKVNLGIMPERFIMTYALNRGQNGFTVHYSAAVHADIEIESLLNHAFQDFYLYFAHERSMYLAVALIPCDAEHGILLLKAAEKRECRTCITALGKHNSVIEHRFEKRRIHILFKAKTLPGEGCREAADGGDFARGCGIHLFKFTARIQAYCGYFFIKTISLDAIG